MRIGVWIQCQPQTVQIAATQVTQKTLAVLILQILQCLALIGLNQVNLTLKLQELYSEDDDNSEHERLTDLSWYVQLL